MKGCFMFLAVLGFSAHAATTPYDNFDGSDLIDTSRWQDPVNFSNFIENGKLRVEQKRLGSTRSNDVRFSDPNSVDAIQATVNVAQISDSGALVRARVGGFFCDSDNTANGSIGEIFAETGIGQRDIYCSVGYYPMHQRKLLDAHRFTGRHDQLWPACFQYRSHHRFGI